MPTPFYHLSLAEDLLDYTELSEKLRQFLRLFIGAFSFGTTAPDVQVVSGQTREKTHFFSLPIVNGEPEPWKLLLAEYPQLGDPKRLSTSRMAFLAGYLCHLQADWMWVKEIFAPVFGPDCTWGSFRERLYLHNALRAYLDIRILPKLRTGLDACLAQVDPDDWLPFESDNALTQWRDLLYPQFQPGAASQTVEVFSSRQGVSAPEFQDLLDSKERMQCEVFDHLPLQEVRRYHQRVLKANAQLLSAYLASSSQDVVYRNLSDEIIGVQP